MKLAVLLTVHNRKDKTVKSLSCLFSCHVPNGVSYDVFMTDDGSVDGTAEAVTEQFPEVRIIQGDGNLFWNRGMIAAWEEAERCGKYDGYLWLNDDTFVFENMLVSMMACSMRHPEAIIVAPTCSKATGMITYGGTINDRHYPPEGKDLKVKTLNGNIVFVPISVRERIGILDKRFSHSLGDTEYGLRAGRKGVEVWQSDEYLGTCEKHDHIPDWCNKSVPLRKRWKALYSPLGCNPREFFICDRHNGLIPACSHYCSIHLRVLFPWLWKIS